MSKQVDGILPGFSEWVHAITERDGLLILGEMVYA
jgi:hypothetical protein